MQIYSVYMCIQPPRRLVFKLFGCLRIPPVLPLLCVGLDVAVLDEVLFWTKSSGAVSVSYAPGPLVEAPPGHLVPWDSMGRRVVVLKSSGE